jgi:hypothetical protein
MLLSPSMTAKSLLVHGQPLQPLSLSPDGQSVLSCNYGVPSECRLFQKSLFPYEDLYEVIEYSTENILKLHVSLGS